jgi:flagellar hook-basal body complex protein FliE
MIDQVESARNSAVDAAEKEAKTLGATRGLTDDTALGSIGPVNGLPGGPVAPSFGDVLSGFLKNVNDAQSNSAALTEALALGEPVDVHQVMLALNEASNAMNLTLQVRSHVLKAYQDLMQIPL